ncbi:MAG: SGNH/GDSL hydrolase family protein [Verrucomicrobiales bacterium]|nr:SGNH/GDSL hydrolase family protein [Verrucomicrobiales bacterium]
MEQILVYGDSLSWGIIPNTRKRLPFTQRWPGVLETLLVAGGRHIRVIEDCLNGRRTVWEDPFKPGRMGAHGLGQRIEANSPLAAVIVMLGTNDFQSCHQNGVWHSAQGLAAIIRAIRVAPVEPEMPVPPILIVAPPAIQNPHWAMALKFSGAQLRCVGMAEAYRQVATHEGCSFFDSAAVTTSSVVDGIHLDADQHERLGRALLSHVLALLSDGKRP